MDDNDNIVDEAENERFNSMLNAAQKHVGASQDDSSGDQAGGGLTAGGGKLSQAQIEAMLALNTSGGGFGDDEPPEDSGPETGPVGAPEPEHPKAEPELPKDEDQLIAEKLREGLAAEMQPQESEPEAPAGEENGKKKAKKEKKPKGEKAPKEPKGKTEAAAEGETEKPPRDTSLLSKIITIAAAVVSLALGFCICLLMFTDFIKSGNEQFAIKAANAVNSKLKLNTEFYVYKAYVWNRELSDECMIYALTSYGGEDKMDIYRVVVEHSSPIVNVYYTISEDDESYLRMKESDDSKIRIQASVKKQYSDTIYAADREIQINAPKWQKINCTVINKNITSVQEG